MCPCVRPPLALAQKLVLLTRSRCCRCCCYCRPIAQDERTALLAEDEALTAKLAEVQAVYAKLRDNDPEVLQELADVVQLAKDGANRWIDNTFNAQSYFTRKRGMPASEAKRVLRMPEEFDYVE